MLCFSTEPSFPLIINSQTEGASCRVSWSRPKFSTGLNISYTVSVKYVKSFHFLPEECQSTHQRNFKVQISDTSYSYENAYADSLYAFQVQAINNGDEISDSSSIIQCRTPRRAPGKVRNFRIVNEIGETGNVSMSIVKWEYPCEPNGKLEKFTIFVNNLEINEPHYVNVAADNRSNFAYQMSSLKLDNDDFMLKIRGEGREQSRGIEDSLILCSSRGCAIPNLTNFNSVLERVNHTAYATRIQLTILNSIFLSTQFEADEIVEISILIAQINCRHAIQPRKGLRRNAEKLRTWSDVQQYDECVPQYRTAVVSREILDEKGNSDNFKVMIGADSACVYLFENCNGPLKPSTWYGIVFRLSTSRGFADSSFISVRTQDEAKLFESSVGLFIIAFSFLGILFSLIVFIVICWTVKSNMMNKHVK